MATTKISEGEAAPEFELPGTGGRTYRLSDYRGRWVVLAFYPSDFTPVCTRQFCSYRDDAELLGSLEAELLGISPQSLESHERFTSAHGLNVSLLADESKRVARDYGVLGPAGYVRRAVFIVDPDGIVRHRNVSLLGLGYTALGEIADHLMALRQPV